MDQKLYEIEKLASDNFPKLLTLNVRVIEQSMVDLEVDVFEKDAEKDTD